MQRDQNWLHEVDDVAGCAFSLKVREHLHSEKSDWQQIDIYETESFGTLMTIDGFIMLSDRDNFLYHEMMTHPVLFSHPQPRNVVIIGGGDCGTLREVLRHEQVEQATQVELDERVTRLAEQYFPELCEANNDPRAQFYFGDGIEWMRQAEADSIDVIIVDSTDPIGPAVGLFSAEFYADCARALRAGGLLIQQSESPLYHMPIVLQMNAAMREGGFADVRHLHYPQPVYPSGWWSATMAGLDGAVQPVRVPEDLPPFETRYYSGPMHHAALTLPPFMRRAVAQGRYHPEDVGEQPAG